MRIVHYPHPSLTHRSVPVTLVDKELRLQVGRMFELMYEAKGLGLAAPQVALPFQLLVTNPEADPERPEAEQVFINPRIVRRKGTMDGEEGCLSFPGLYAKVRRSKQVSVEAFDLQGNKVSIDAKDLDARLWQHEIDHLNGRLFIERFSAVAKITTHRDLKAFEKQFRTAQESGDVPEEAEIERLLFALEQQMAVSK